MLHQADETGKFLIAKNSRSVFLGNCYRQTKDNVKAEISIFTHRQAFMDYLHIIQQIIHWKNSELGTLYARNLYYLMRDSNKGFKTKFVRLFLTIECLPSSLVVSETRGYAVGSFKTTHQAGDQIVNSFTTLGSLPNVDWNRPDVGIEITGQVRAIIIVEQKQAAQCFTESRIIVVSTQGIPDSGTKYFLEKLVGKLPNVPCYGCFDFDLGGFQIFENLKYGSQSSAWQRPPLPMLQNIIYPFMIDFLDHDLHSEGAFIQLPADKRNALQLFKQRHWLELEKYIEESLEIIDKSGTVSLTYLCQILPGFFKAELHL